MNTIVILMSAYNGERFLAEQIQSIQQQTISDWKLLIRDDGSVDHTINIIKKFVEQDSRIIFIEDTLGNLKPTQSFSTLLGYYLDQYQAEYVFFADQDDVWLSNKLALQISALKSLDSTTPALVFSDLTVVNQDLTVRHRSHFVFENLIPRTQDALKMLLAYNYVTGCTMGMNRALAQLAFPIPSEAMMHDWWCALCAAAFGQLVFVPAATVLYRQHGANERGSSGFENKIKNIFQNWKMFRLKFSQQKESFKNRFRQALVLAKYLQKKQNDNEIVNQFCSLLQKKRLMRLYSVFQHHLVPGGVVRRGVFLLFIMMV